MRVAPVRKSLSTAVTERCWVEPDAESGHAVQRGRRYPKGDVDADIDQLLVTEGLLQDALAGVPLEAGHSRLPSGRRREVVDLPQALEVVAAEPALNAFLEIGSLRLDRDAAERAETVERGRTTIASFAGQGLLGCDSRDTARPSRCEGGILAAVSTA